MIRSLILFEKNKEISSRIQQLKSGILWNVFTSAIRQDKYDVDIRRES